MACSIGAALFSATVMGERKPWQGTFYLIWLKTCTRYMEEGGRRVWHVLAENRNILHQCKSLSGYPFLHLNWYISDYYISHSSSTTISDNYTSKRILLPQYSYVFTIFIRRFVFTVSRIEVTRNGISSNYAGKPDDCRSFLPYSSKKIMQLF